MTQFHERPEKQRRIIAHGVENLKEFGYPQVDVDNIMTDPVFSKFFKSMLEENQGADEAIDALLAKIG